MQDFVMNDEQRELAEKHHDLIYKVANEWGFDVDEYYGDMAIGLCYAVGAIGKCCKSADFDKIATEFMVAECYRPTSKYYY